MRRLPPVVSPVSLGALVAAPVRQRGAASRVQETLAARFQAKAVALTDSGTSALVLAIRATVPRGGTVALPAYGCVDLLAAAAFAGVRVRLYDVDPATLSPDLDSVRATLARGANAIVVAHFYGFPADVPGVASLAAEHGAPVIEDAAQHAYGSLRGTALGALGPLVVLSFGRGKGTMGGGGGALLARDDAWYSAVAEWSGASSVGIRNWVVSTAVWAVGRPSLYGIPASIPALRLGETIYHEAHEPEALPALAAALLTSTLATAARDAAQRVANARALIDALRDARGLELPRALDGGTSGYLRLPVIDYGSRGEALAQGIVRTYPRPLNEEPAGQHLFYANEPDTPGAKLLATHLLTLPTHVFVTDTDRKRAVAWGHATRR